ncbi:unnamed protein product [Effrenium voratum]|nr:unnamed protein product [Effrenium voratum]
MEQLVSMGFAPALAKQALLLCGNSVEAAADLLLTNPPPLPDGDGIDGLQELLSMGFPEDRAKEALDRHGNLADAAEALSDAAFSAAVEAEASAPVVVPAVAAPVAAPVAEPVAAPVAARSSAPAAVPDSADRAIERPAKRRRAEPSELGVEARAAGLGFGAEAFGPLARPRAASNAAGAGEDLTRKVAKMVLASVPGVAEMRGERGQVKVTAMLSRCYTQGLWIFGPASCPVNAEILPAYRHIIGEMAKLEPQNPKRVSVLTTLAQACQDCQQVQAREILRIYGDLTSQNETLEWQLKYSLVRLKEAALNRFITRRHPNCDLDHTQVQPWQQRPHLLSGYVVSVGHDFGLDGMAAAKNDRFLSQVTMEIKNTLRRKEKHLLKDLQQEMCVTEWLQTLLADINNQSADADRLINRDCIFKWAQDNMANAHLVFYDEERFHEFRGQDPERPDAGNEFQPFLSCRVLVEMLLTAKPLGKFDSAPKAMSSSQLQPFFEAGSACAVWPRLASKQPIPVRRAAVQCLVRILRCDSELGLGCATVSTRSAALNAMADDALPPSSAIALVQHFAAAGAPDCWEGLVASKSLWPQLQQMLRRAGGAADAADFLTRFQELVRVFPRSAWTEGKAEALLQDILEALSNARGGFSRSPDAAWRAYFAICSAAPVVDEAWRWHPVLLYLDTRTEGEASPPQVTLPRPVLAALPAALAGELPRLPEAEKLLDILGSALEAKPDAGEPGYAPAWRASVSLIQQLLKVEGSLEGLRGLLQGQLRQLFLEALKLPGAHGFAEARRSTQSTFLGTILVVPRLV